MFRLFKSGGYSRYQFVADTAQNYLLKSGLAIVKLPVNVYYADNQFVGSPNE
jgi:hypothetical protein